MADMKWIKLATDIFDDEKILLLESMPDADSAIVIWIKLLTLAGKQNNSGVFAMSNGLPYTDKMLATIFRRKESTVEMALSFFEQFGMIERINGVITIPNWEKHQSVDRLENIKNYQREYHRQYRKKQKMIAEQTATNTENDGSKIDRKLYGKIDGKPDNQVCVNTLEERKEVEVEVEKKKNKKPREKDILVVFAGADAELLTALKEFSEYRTKVKKPLTDAAKTRLVKKLQSLFDDDHLSMVKSLNKSVDCGWTDVYPIKDSKQSQEKQQPVFNPGTTEYGSSVGMKSFLDTLKE